jgi:hypothetical protein
VERVCARIEERLTTEGVRATSYDTAGFFLEEAKERFREAEKALYQLY